jgi:hypothetical protein
MTLKDTEFKRYIDLTDKIFSRLTVKKQVGTDIHRNKLWSCRCQCGRIVVVSGNRLRNQHTRSCGCLQADLAWLARFRHGYSQGAPIYRSWTAMMQRCTNPNNPRWKDYGGRGITVCEKWRVFDGFLADMGPRPSGKSLDRIDPNGNYELNNTRWATPKEQANNRKCNVK